MSRTYERLPCAEFGRRLLEIGDLDPLYIGLYGMRAHRELPPFLLSYWCFYHIGAASHMADQHRRSLKAYWETMRIAAQNEEPTPHGTRWPRAAERRHFRGKKCVDAIVRIQREFIMPAHFVETLRASKAAEVVGLAKKRPMFGDWSAFKIADMMERTIGHPVSFDEADVLMFDAPRQGALMLCERELEDETRGLPEIERIRTALAHLKSELGGITAPGGPARPLGIQEFETILCKWKSHLNGHYPIGKDIRELRQHLEEWPGDFSSLLLANMPALPAQENMQ